MELALKINTWAIAITFVFFIITLVWMIKSKGNKPNKRIQRGVCMLMILVAIWRLVLDFLTGNSQECTLSAFFVMLIASLIVIASALVKM